MRKDGYRYDPALALTFSWGLGLLRCAGISDDFGDVSKLQYEYRKKLFDLYYKFRDNKTEDYFKQVRALEREQKKAIQQAAKAIYDEVKEAIGHEYKIKGKSVVNKFNFWLYKGNTGMKITTLVNDTKVMTLKCGRDIDHETSGAKEKVQVVLGNEDKLNKKKDKDRFITMEAGNAKDIVNAYIKSLKEVL